MTEKPVEWVGSSLVDIRRFPDDARRRAGFELQLVQHGATPSDSKPMPTVGAGVAEIRIRTGTEHRLFFIARFEEAVYVLHAFEKKSQKTARKDIELGRARLAEVLASRDASTRRRK
jgi:phage-related protein